jgi:hypothetical protein
MNVAAKPDAVEVEIHGNFIDGREFGTESFDDHFNVKSVMVATNPKDFDWYRDTSAQRRLN